MNFQIHWVLLTTSEKIKIKALFTRPVNVTIFSTV